MRRQTQADDVERALVELGGYATLADLYKRILPKTGAQKRPSPLCAASCRWIHASSEYALDCGG
jgi:hypothetical protein